jgi:F-type H+-transporting ATPase subunit delta
LSVGEIALVYARALFEAAGEAGSVERTGADLRSFVGALERSPELANVVLNPQIEPEAKRRVIGQLTADGDRLVAGVLVVLLEKGRIDYVGEVADAFEELAAAASRVVDVEVTTAVPADSRIENEIRSRVQKATGLEPRISNRVDPAILGGLVLRIGDVVVDGSVRGRIRQLGTRLKEVQA